MIDDAGAREAVALFKERLGVSSSIELVREMITHGSSAIVDNRTFSDLRTRTGKALGVSPNRDVFMVGSAKLGFSIKQSRRYLSFSDESDIDLAVVSPELYCRLWGEVRRFSRQGGDWLKGNRNHFRNDHLNGVIKHYTAPDSDVVPTKRRLFDLESALQRGGSVYPVTIAIWHSIEALEDYQCVAVEDCQEELRK